MRGRLTAYLQLVRLPNVLTAAADSLAGWLLVGGALSDARHWLPMVAASIVLYASGTALNDVFDIEIDRAERPGRPLPSGRIPLRLAATLGGLGLLIGPVVAMASGSVTSVVVAMLLAGCILSYDAGMKHTVIGPAFMGGCRGLNLLMGMAAVPSLGGPAAWTAAIAYALFVAGITIISRSETHEGRRRDLVVGLIVLDGALFGLAGSAITHPRFPQPTTGGSAAPIVGLIVFGLIAALVNRAAFLALKEPGPRSIQRTVKTGILSLVWLNVGLVAAVRGIEPAAAVAILWVPAYLLGRWLYST